MFHSSLSSLGTVVGGPDAVLDGMLDALGPRGTLVAPTLCQRDKDRRFETWDLQHSPSDVGLLTEVLRKRPLAVRSDHATHSVAALGAQAEALTQGHAHAGPRRSPWGAQAFGHDSPWDRFYRWNVHYLFLGVDFRVNTMRHYIQSVLVEGALVRTAPERRDELSKRVRGWRKEGVWPDYSPEEMEAHLKRLGLVRCGTIGSAVFRLIRAHDMVDAALAALQGEPERWFGEDFLRWLRETSAEPC
ncbi:MAG: AAC(3) family N-acetyltransferase [Armatimonadetes bacterium]|nr:AAC(3) family N-acetyltransferase [Armatimonadota bacterium]